jgi:hypothetical protein
MRVVFRPLVYWVALLAEQGKRRKIQTLQLPLQVNNGLNPAICEICARHGNADRWGCDVRVAPFGAVDFPHGTQIVLGSWQVSAKNRDRARDAQKYDAVQRQCSEFALSRLQAAASRQAIFPLLHDAHGSVVRS